MEFPVTVRPEAPTPIYLQIKYQLRYFITSGRLAEGTRLPTVRAAADHLQVNPGTVAQAYRELQEQGLLEAAPGRGTFVATTLATDGDAAKRQRLLAEALERALQRARALGFRQDEIQQHAATVFAASREGVPVAFAAPTMKIARKYATSLEHRLGSAISVHPLSFDELERRAPHVAALLETVYFVVTFAGAVRRVESALAGFASPTRVLGCTTEVQPHSLAGLDRLDPDSALCLVTQEPYVPPTLNLIEQRTGRTANEVAVCLDGDVATARTSFPRADKVIYTFVAREFVLEQDVPTAKRFEISFDVTDASVTRLREVLLLDPASAEAPAGEG